MNERRLVGALIAPGLVSSLVLAVSLTGVCAPARAAAAPPAMREIQMQSRHTYRYTCSTGKTLRVTYLGAANGQSFALVPVAGRTLLLVATIAASGVRYQGDRYTWWTKGRARTCTTRRPATTRSR